MQYRHLLRLTTLTAFVFFMYTPVIHAQRARNTIISQNLESGNISGIVSTTAGPLDGVRVVLSHEGKAIIDIITGANGAYAFKALRPGKYDISFFKTGYRKRIVNSVPVVEKCLTYNDLILSKLNSWREERNPNIQFYEDLENHKIEKMK